jgi:hypothetical protein
MWSADKNEDGYLPRMSPQMTTAMISNFLMKHDDVTNFLLAKPNRSYGGMARFRAIDALKRQIAAHTALGVQIEKEIETLQEQLIESFRDIQDMRYHIFSGKRRTSNLEKEFFAPVNRLHILDEDKYSALKTEMQKWFESLNEEIDMERADVYDEEQLRIHDLHQATEEARLVELRDERKKNLAHTANLEASLTRLMSR